MLLIVDELDRCLPTYAIKVLERLHHLFDGIENVIIVLAIDSIQLEHSIQEIYGENVDTKNYLKKFIDFSLKVDDGSVQEKLSACYRDYFDQFEASEYILDQVTRIIQLSEIRIRSLEKMIDKLYLIHRIVFQDQEDARVLLFEIIWGILSCKTAEQEDMVSNYKYNIKKYFIELAEIHGRNYDELPEILGYSLYEYLKQLRINANEYDKKHVIMVKRNKQGELNLSLWYVIEKVSLGKASFNIEDETKYQKLLKSCQEFYSMANIVDGDFQ